MKRRLLFAILALLVSSAPVSAAECKRPADLPEPELQVTVLEPRVVLRHDVDLFGLPKVGQGVDAIPAGLTLQGLTRHTDMLDVRVAYREVTMPRTRQACLWIEKVTATVGLPEQMVYIAADYPEDSCEYKAIRAHEDLHVEINRQAAQDFAPLIREALQNGIADSLPLVTPIRHDDAILARRLRSYAESGFHAMQDEMRRRNAAIDTPEAYKSLSEDSGCTAWKGRMRE